MPGLSLGLGLGLISPVPAGLLQSGPPSAIVLSNTEIEASLNGAAATILMVGGMEPATFSLLAGSDSAFSISGDQLLADGTQTAGTSTANIRVTDANGATFDDSFSITVAATVTNPAGILVGDGVIQFPDPNDPASDQGGYDQDPVQADTSSGLKVTGKNGGSATWFKSIALPAAGTDVTYTYQADWSGMSRNGREAAVGFAFKSGNQFHLVGVRGNGSNPASMRASRLYGDFRKANQFTITNDGAATGTTKDGPNYLKISVSGDGTKYSVFVGPDVNNLTEVYTNGIPSPMSGVDAATEFGIGGYFTNTDKGVFSITITEASIPQVGISFIQKATLRNGGTVSLPTAPTVGNTMVWMCAGYDGTYFGGGGYAPSDFDYIGKVIANNQHIHCWIRKVQDGDTGSFSPSYAGYPQAGVLYEFSNVATVVKLAGDDFSSALSGTNMEMPLPVSPFGANDIVLGVLENDTVNGYSVTPATGYTEDFNVNDADNHSSVFFRLDETYVGVLEGTVDGSLSYPIFGLFVLVSADSLT